MISGVTTSEGSRFYRNGTDQMWSATVCGFAQKNLWPEEAISSAEIVANGLTGISHIIFCFNRGTVKLGRTNTPQVPRILGVSMVTNICHHCSTPTITYLSSRAPSQINFS